MYANNFLKKVHNAPKLSYCIFKLFNHDFYIQNVGCFLGIVFRPDNSPKQLNKFFSVCCKRNLAFVV